MPFTDAALWVSKPSGMGGARQLLGAWRGGGLPGVGDTGLLTWSPQAYLSTRTDPTPTTKGSAKATGEERNLGRPEGRNHISCTSWRQAEEVVGPRDLLEAVKWGRQAECKEGSWKVPGRSRLDFKKG